MPQKPVFACNDYTFLDEGLGYFFSTHRELATGGGIEVSDIWHGPPFPVEARQPGPHPKRTSYRSFSCFTDPDGNTWLLQEVTTRLWSAPAPRPEERR